MTRSEEVKERGLVLALEYHRGTVASPEDVLATAQRFSDFLFSRNSVPA